MSNRVNETQRVGDGAEREVKGQRIFDAPVGRRRFLGMTSKVAAGFLIVPRHIIGRGATPPSERLNIAGIGIGGQGAADLSEMSEENVVALCDVDWDYAAPTFEKYPSAKRYRDFREMLDKERGIDAVVVATPDHTHAVVSVAAMRRGKHVYCEKPLTRTVTEARVVSQVARETKRVTQMGNQGMAFEGNRLIKEWIGAGVIGPVREVHVWSDRPTHRGKMPLWWPQGVERSVETPPVPVTLDWDLWLGPAPWRPYHPDYVPFRWRGWWDFGSGGLGDMGIHNLAPVFSALKLGAPTSVTATSTPVFKETVPVAAMVHYEFPAREDMPAVKLHWYDGGLLPERPADLEDDRTLNPEDGIIFVGDEGTMLVEGWGGENPRLLPASRHRTFERPPKTLPRSIGHYAEFIRACKTGSSTESNFGFSGPLTEAVLLGSVAIRVGGEKLVWDHSNLKISGLPEAEVLLHYAYREGWSL
jgi:predicted dehydrogenase